jgi:hypothetical protein
MPILSNLRKGEKLRLTEEAIKQLFHTEKTRSKYRKTHFTFTKMSRRFPDVVRVCRIGKNSPIYEEFHEDYLERVLRKEAE